MGPALTPNSELVARRRQRVAAEIIEARVCVCVWTLVLASSYLY